MWLAQIHDPAPWVFLLTFGQPRRLCVSRKQGRNPFRKYPTSGVKPGSRFNCAAGPAFFGRPLQCSEKQNTTRIHAGGSAILLKLSCGWNQRELSRSCGSFFGCLGFRCRLHMRAIFPRWMLVLNIAPETVATAIPIGRDRVV